MTQETTLKNRARAKEWYKNNRDKALLRIRNYSADPIRKKKKKDYDTAYRTLNNTKIKERLNLWYVANSVEMKDKARRWKQQNPERAQFLRYIERAKEKNSSFELSYEHFVEVIKMPCVYCGFSDGIVGLDRIDSHIGYLLENIVPCCKTCNFMKLDHSLESWLNSMREIFENLGYEIKMK